MPRIARLLALSVLVLSALPATLCAQDSNPQLTARIQGIDSEAAAAKLAIELLDLSVRIHGTIAETTITARFANPGEQILEGDFRLTLPSGSVVTGYALDVNGRMIDGVLVDQRQARVAYEARVRQRIDPGLAEIDRDNLFHTRVFPIVPRSGRTVRVQFTTPLDPRAGYALPIRETAEIGAFRLRVEASGVRQPPQLSLPGGGTARWTSEGDVHRFALDRRGAGLAGSLVIGAPEPASPILVSRSANGEAFFQISDSLPRPRDRDGPPVRRVAILWDRSLSRADDDLAAEIALLRAYLDQARPGSIELILFDAAAAERRTVANAAELVSLLQGVRYRGATSLAVLGEQGLSGADSCLLFSDGIATIDRSEELEPACPLFTISSAGDANRPYLRALARASGGEAFELGRLEAREIVTRLTRRLPRVVSVRSTGGARIDHSLLEAGENGWRIVGPMPASGGVVVRLAGVPAGEAERIYTAGGAAADLNGAAALWAAERVAVLAASDEAGRDSVVALSRRYSVASPEVSFLVLETGRDYAEARIDPPASLPAELLADYRTARDDMKRRETEQRSQRLELVLSQWQEMRDWWARRNDRAVPRVRPQGNVSAPVVAVPSPDSVQAPPSEPPAPPPPPLTSPAPIITVEQSGGEDITVTGSSIDSSQAAARPPRGTIAIEPWAADRPYLAAINDAAPADFERVFAEQQAAHGKLPAFWLDMADWAWRKGRRADAIQLVLSALELPTRDNQTLSIVAERLMRYGETDRAISLYERLLAAEDERPQPRRSLALALARRAESAALDRARSDLARAIALLTEVVMTPWHGAYEGIEMISLMEVNRLIPRYRRIGGEQVTLDPRLIALLDVDLRVVIEWFTEATDVDLWIDEPSGERAIYHNPRTAIGGRLSNDMTQGYGPEEYLLRRAVPGTYEVRANIFSSDRINPNGAQRVTARIIRDFGRPSEREELVDLEILPDDPNRERRVGRVVFEGPAPRR